MTSGWLDMKIEFSIIPNKEAEIHHFRLTSTDNIKLCLPYY